MVASDTFRQLSLLMAASTMALGINGLLRPHAALGMLGLNVPPPTSFSTTTTKDKSHSAQVLTPLNAAHFMTQLYGARNILFTTLTILVTLSPREGGSDRLLARVWMANSGLAFLDGLISRARLGPGTEWLHWGFVPVGLALSTGLLGYF